jgi:hypothetical protein
LAVKTLQPLSQGCDRVYSNFTKVQSVNSFDIRDSSQCSAWVRSFRWSAESPGAALEALNLWVKVDRTGKISDFSQEV